MIGSFLYSNISDRVPSKPEIQEKQENGAPIGRKPGVKFKTYVMYACIALSGTNRDFHDYPIPSPYCWEPCSEESDVDLSVDINLVAFQIRSWSNYLVSKITVHDLHSFHHSNVGMFSDSFPPKKMFIKGWGHIDRLKALV